MRNLFGLGVVLSVVAMLLGGCAQLDVEQGYQLAPTSGKGVLAFGMTASDNIPNFFWHLRKVGTTDSRDITFYNYKNPLMWQKPRGRLALVELDEGEYEFYDWELPMNVGSKEYFQIPFSVKAGRVTYMGRVHLELKPDYRYSITSNNAFRAEDVALVRAKIPGVADDAIQDQVVKVLPCAQTNCAKSKR